MMFIKNSLLRSGAPKPEGVWSTFQKPAGAYFAAACNANDMFLMGGTAQLGSCSLVLVDLNTLAFGLISKDAYIGCESPVTLDSKWYSPSSVTVIGGVPSLATTMINEIYIHSFPAGVHSFSSSVSSGSTGVNFARPCAIHVLGTTSRGSALGGTVNSSAAAAPLTLFKGRDRTITTIQKPADMYFISPARHQAGAVAFGGAPSTTDSVTVGVYSVWSNTWYTRTKPAGCFFCNPVAAGIRNGASDWYLVGGRTSDYGDVWIAEMAGVAPPYVETVGVPQGLHFANPVVVGSKVYGSCYNELDSTINSEVQMGVIDTNDWSVSYITKPAGVCFFRPVVANGSIYSSAPDNTNAYTLGIYTPGA